MHKAGLYSFCCVTETRYFYPQTQDRKLKNTKASDYANGSVKLELEVCFVNQGQLWLSISSQSEKLPGQPTVICGPAPDYPLSSVRGVYVCCWCEVVMICVICVSACGFMGPCAFQNMPHTRPSANRQEAYQKEESEGWVTVICEKERVLDCIRKWRVTVFCKHNVCYGTRHI